MANRTGRLPSPAHVGIASAVVAAGLAGTLPAPVFAQLGDTAVISSDAAAAPALRFRPILAGAGFGAAAAIAAINPTGPSALTDESLFALGLATGSAFGILVQRPGAELAFASGWGVVRVGQLRDQLESDGERRQPMGPQAWETRLSLLFSTAGRWSAGPLLGVLSHGFEQVEQETRCGFFGCISGDFVTSYSNLQALNAGALARLTPGGPHGRFFATFGTGLGAVRLDSTIGEGSAVLPYLEAGAGAARAAGLFRALEAGLRLQGGEVGPTRVDMTGLFFRLHLTLGPRT